MNKQPSNPLWSDNLTLLSPYVPGEQSNAPSLVKLNTNENPYPPSPKVLAAIREAADADLRLYPDPEGSALKSVLARTHGLAAEQIFVGNGSDEVLAHIFFALLKHPKPLLFPDISYSFYPVYCSLYQIDYQTIPLNQDFEIELDDYAQPNGGIIFPNPNAPTGLQVGLDNLRELLGRNPDSVVVIDEAYVDFGGPSALELVHEFNNVVVVQTVSKSRSLAGLRVGYAFAAPDLIDALNLVKGCFNSYPLDRLALVGAQAALEDVDHFEIVRGKVINTRSNLSQSLKQLGFEVLPSNANFVFARHGRLSGSKLQLDLRARNILVRHFNHPRINNFLRITVGTDEQCEQLIEALAQIIAAER